MENIAFVGGWMLIVGFALAALGGYLFSIGSTPEAALELSIFGSLLIFTGAIFVAAGHIGDLLRPRPEEAREKEKSQAITGS